MDNINFFISSLLFFVRTCPILPECSLILGLVLILGIDLLDRQIDVILSYKICLISVSISLISLICQWKTDSVQIVFENIHITNFTNIFRLFILVCSALSILISVDYIRCTKTALAEFLSFILAAGSGGMFLCVANDLVTIYVALECLSLSSYLMSGYTKRDIRSNEATIKFFLMGGASSSFLLYGFSLLYALSDGHLQLDVIAHQLLSSEQSVVSPICAVFLLAALAFKLSLVPFHQWTPDVYEGV